MSVDLRICAVIAIIGIVLAAWDDRRWIGWIREGWAATAGAWFAQRRIVSGLNKPRVARIRIGAPDEHSAGIMVARRDINVGWWT